MSICNYNLFVVHSSSLILHGARPVSLEFIHDVETQLTAEDVAAEVQSRVPIAGARRLGLCRPRLSGLPQKNGSEIMSSLDLHGSLCGRLLTALCSAVQVAMSVTFLRPVPSVHGDVR